MPLTAGLQDLTATGNAPPIDTSTSGNPYAPGAQPISSYSDTPPGPTAYLPSGPGAGNGPSYAPNDPNNPAAPQYAAQPAAATTTTNAPSDPSAPQMPDWSKFLQVDNTVGLKALDIQQQFQNWQMNTYYPQQMALQQALSYAQQTGDLNGVQTLASKLQDLQGQLATQQNYVNTVIGMGNLTGMVGNQPTQAFQQIQNQLALQQGNLGLGARQQDLAALQAGLQYGNNYQNTLAGYGAQTGNTLASFGSNAGNNLTSYGTQTGNTLAQYGTQMQALANQMATSPLTAWYTARGLPPPASAFQQSGDSSAITQALLAQENGQNPFGQSLLAQANGQSPYAQQLLSQAQGQGPFGQALLNQAGAPPQNQRQLNQFAMPQMNWTQNPVNVGQQQQWTPPANDQQAQAVYNKLIQGYQQVRQRGDPWDAQAFIGVAAMAGIPAQPAQVMWDAAQKQGTAAGGMPAFMSALNQAVASYKQQQGGPMGAITTGTQPWGNAPPVSGGLLNYSGQPIGTGQPWQPPQ